MKDDAFAVNDEIFLDGEAEQRDVPIWAVERGAAVGDLPLSVEQRTWLEALGFKGTAKQHVLLPGADGGIAGVLFGLGNGIAGEPCGPSELLIGQLAQSLPAGEYR